MRQLKSVCLAALSATCAVALSGPVLAVQQLGPDGAGNRRPNILFIAVDDLRPELGCYGNRQIKSPNIDRLASRGMVFDRAYCQQAICMASRGSLLSGCRPDTAAIWTNRNVRHLLPDAVFLPQHFKNHGYYTVGMGKVFHNGHEDRLSWSEPHWMPDNYSNAYCTVAGRALVKRVRDEALAAGKEDPFKHIAEHVRRGMPYEALDVGDSELSDGQIADHAISTLRRVKGKPFFLGVGFLRPHLPFVAPRKYWDLYRSEEIRLARNPFPPSAAPEVALHNSSELRQQYQGVPKSGPVDPELARSLIHGYYACVSYMDAQIGRVLDELERLDLADNTLVVLWGDHGWHLGEHGLWCKHTNFEVATRAPLIISAPGIKAAGQRTSSLVEFVGIYPTLCDLAGLPRPLTLEGTSFAQLLDDPTLQISQAAFSQYPRGQVMGYSMRTERYRYTEWRSVTDGAVQASELYDHSADPDENVNLANDAKCSQTVKELAAKMKAGLPHIASGVGRGLKSVKSNPANND